MRVQGKDYRTIWMEGSCVFMINQNQLPFRFEIYRSDNYLSTCDAISRMIVRGAGAIGAAAGFAMSQACLSAPKDGYENYILEARDTIQKTRPTARDLFYASDLVFAAGLNSPVESTKVAQELAFENEDKGRRIGEIGCELIKEGSRIETHCNAGWLGFVDYGSALAPVYLAHRRGINLLVYVDETRPRNQGARLTAWELQQEGVPHKIICDHTGAWLMAQNKINMVIVGADRIAANGDVANKIGTLEKAIVAREFGIPFYVAAPTSTFDPECRSGSDIPIEERDMEEITFQSGYQGETDTIVTVRIASTGSEAINPAFDVTPARYITGIITEKGMAAPDETSISEMLE